MKAFYYVGILTKIYLNNFLFGKKSKDLTRFSATLPVSDEHTSRVDYYCKINHNFKIQNPSLSLSTLKINTNPTMPTLDLLEKVSYYDRNMQFNCYLRDFNGKITSPSFVKCRAIVNDNHNYILLRLNNYRFFSFQKDYTPFNRKESKAIFRGPCHKDNRKKFVENNFNIPLTDIRDTKNASKGKPYFAKRTPISWQLKHKFIISIEGHDVASNLPWIMASNSLAFMTKPKFEGWFMQGRLVPNYHYVLLKEDYSDLEEKIDYYSSNTDEALEIINNAKRHVAQFFDKKRELMISLLVLEKYFKLSGQIE